MDIQSIIWVVVAIIWFIFSSFNNKKKREAELNKKAGKPVETERRPKNAMEEVLRELQRRAESIERPEVVNPKPNVAKTIKDNKHQNSNKQKLVKGKDIFSMDEKRKSMEYEEYVRKQRRKEHDAENRHLEEKIQNYYAEDVNTITPIIDLRDIIIADAILNRPYADR
ncbi:MAG: hypothetical protein IPG60_11580 [Bacteroidetes bacterium]|nr:hypothetical protein [Bacteroidota bacterium]